MSGKPDWKPERRIVDRKATRRSLLLHPECVACGARASNGHHLVPRGQRGDDVPENIVPLCGEGNTSGCHGKIHDSDLQTAVAIRRGMRPEQIAYVIAKKGEEWLNRKYPSQDAPNATGPTALSERVSATHATNADADAKLGSNEANQRSGFHSASEHTAHAGIPTTKPTQGEQSRGTATARRATGSANSEPTAVASAMRNTPCSSPPRTAYVRSAGGHQNAGSPTTLRRCSL